MRQFSYLGRDGDGRKVSGVIEAVNEKNALIMLRPKVEVVLDLRELGLDEQKDMSVKPAGWSVLWKSLNGYNPSLADKAFLVYQMAAMLEAGIDLVQVLESLAEEHDDPKARRMLSDLAARMRGGESFSEALSHYPRVFNQVFVNVVRAGEESGKLNETLKELSEQMERLYRIRNKVISAVSYPVFTLFVAVAVVLIMLIKVLPMFEKIYSSFGARLPIATRALVAVSHGIRENFFLTGLVLVMLLSLLMYLWKKPEWRLRMEAFIYRMPVFGPLIQEYIYVQICRVLGLLVRSGVHIIDSLRFTSAATPWLRFKRGIDITTEGVSQGQSLALQFKENKVIPGVASRMLAVGEDTGRIDDMLDKVANFYDERVTNKVKILSSLIEPLLIVVLGGIVGLVLVAMYMPVFMLGKVMKGH